MTCAARRATGKIADALEHDREGEREVHIRRSHRRRSLPEQYIVPGVFSPQIVGKHLQNTVASAVTVTRMWKALI
jgi:hypothetical protein